MYSDKEDLVNFKESVVWADISEFLENQLELVEVHLDEASEPYVMFEARGVRKFINRLLGKGNGTNLAEELILSYEAEKAEEEEDHGPSTGRVWPENGARATNF
jgi:hypothetical protein